MEDAGVKRLPRQHLMLDKDMWLHAQALTDQALVAVMELLNEVLQPKPAQLIQHSSAGFTLRPMLQQT